MPSGGRRQGKAGRKYPNRSDMRQAPKATGNQTYGEAGKQLASQAAIPLSRSDAPVGSSPSMAAPGGGGGGPQVIPSLTAPTTRPNEPLTAGLPTGAGPGPEALGMPTSPSEDQNLSAFLHGVYQAYPNPDLARLIASMESR